MGTTNGSSNLKAFEDHTGKYSPFSPSSLPDSSLNVKANEEGLNSSESLLIDEQPSWLDDLLNETETVIFDRGHRRAASDSYAYLGNLADEAFNFEDESKYIDSLFGPCNSMPFRNVGLNEARRGLSLAQKNNQGSEGLVEHSRDESRSRKLEDSLNRATGSDVKPSGSKADSKRSKQHNAHRSRVRKLQYISHLERTLQILKAEGSQFSAELEFLEQQNMLLTMENRALRQRLESISHEQLIKQWEQGMLEREMGRLQTLYHMQKQQQMEVQNPLHHKQRRNRSKENLDYQMYNGPVKNKDDMASPSRGSV
ncbi:basic-leucine zipper transcription factor family protein [Striga asiatica]|uniref:Basic-leucine zipper transcription factor family protein n=1 Tax=Striga asiatica TaxID=4170 RepID=A0A5A7PY79_STRAF|nr:basic-leucine zipper transcription factor family protein [Striga asiatica]